jgi:coproporphyrinogen III oxidase-like Fe-S oxidoreductase
MARQKQDAGSTLPEDELRARIAEAAYHRAEQRGFEPGHEMEDWIEAEKAIKGALLPEREPAELPGD